MTRSLGSVQGCGELKDGRMRAALAAAERPAGLRIAVDRGRDAPRDSGRSAVACLSGTGLPPAVTLNSLRKKSPTGPS